MKLGQRVAAIRSTGKYVQNNESRRKVLDDMGFLWRLRSPSLGKKLDGIAFEQVYEALKTYREQVQPNGALDVPENYVVPDCLPWPDSTRGLPLGKILPAVRTKAYYKQHPEAEAKLNSLCSRISKSFSASSSSDEVVYCDRLTSLVATISRVFLTISGSTLKNSLFAEILSLEKMS